mgnify:CR=1 FL=1
MKFYKNSFLKKGHKCSFFYEFAMIKWYNLNRKGDKMYQALYRKYRPKNFDEIVGQDVIVKTLKNMIINNSLTHAYLFAGPRGTGKTSIAKILAKSINCDNLVNGISCEKCVSCTQINNKQSVDIIEIDAASNNGVDEIREIKSKVNLVPSNSRYKVYIIDEVHMLTTGAFNALLKTLEEPPAHIIFILATTEPQKIPSTILSRCQRFDFKRINDSDLIYRLNEVCEVEKIDIEPSATLEIALISDGGMRDALSILDQVRSYANNTITSEDVHMINGTLTNEQLKKFVLSIIKNELCDIMNLIDEWNNQGKNFTKILEELILFYKNLIIVRQAPEYLKSKEIDLNIYQISGENVSNEQILNIIDILNKNLSEIKKSNIPKLIFEITMLKILSNDVSVNIDNEGKIEKKENISTVEKTDLIDIEKKESNQLANVESKKINNAIKEKMAYIKEVRINNALASFDKKKLLKQKELQEELRTLLIDPDYSQLISMLFDGTLKVAGGDYLVYVFDNETNSDLFNENILKIENIFEKSFGKKYFLISTDNISWEIIKKDFNSKTKEYKYIEETVDLHCVLNEKMETNEIENLFSNTIQYN